MFFLVTIAKFIYRLFPKAGNGNNVNVFKGKCIKIKEDYDLISIDLAKQLVLSNCLYVDEKKSPVTIADL